MYSSKILEIFKNPEHAGGLQGSNGIGKFVDESCGDYIKLYLKIDENQKIVDAHFKTMGSVGAIVASSALCSSVIGITVEDAKVVNAGNILEVTGAYPTEKLYAIDFAIKALNLALENYYDNLEKEASGKGKKKKEEKPKQSKVEKAEEEYIKNKKSLSEALDDLDEEAEAPKQEEKVDLFEKYFGGEDDFISSNLNASKLVENAKTYTPIVETKILSDEDLKELERKKASGESPKAKSDAKANFDALFE